jgi:hypothetical protein
VSPLEHAPRSTIAKIEAAGTRLRARRTSEFVYRRDETGQPHARVGPGYVAPGD